MTLLRWLTAAAALTLTTLAQAEDGGNAHLRDDEDWAAFLRVLQRDPRAQVFIR